uniref:Uncharacterized protein n=1 Tax=Pithovirus LCPAC202 TaxID=2506592 RepID=A0A481Z6X3_9VIRU|nr:MAG: uncharacterized protein LCPAC202_03400 [Pithovirus LCPAC202]
MFDPENSPKLSDHLSDESNFIPNKHIMWLFTNTMSRPWDDTKLQISSVIFGISRYGKYIETINFKSPVTEFEGVRAVEKFFSQPLTEVYFNMIKDDLFNDYTWEEAQEEYNCKGDCLTSLEYLENTHIQDGVLTLMVGS